MHMANFHIITNNPLAADRYPEVSSLHTCSVMEVFRTARDCIHRGATLINHPLSGSVKPNISPYKSLVLSLEKEGVVDFQSLQLIEGAQAVLKKLPANDRTYTTQVLEDFQVIDLDLLMSCIQALPAGYYF